MKQTHRSTAFAACIAISLALAGSSQAAGAPQLSRKKLQVFVLAGQSNMSGYCGIQTLTNLANYHELEDPALRELDQRLCKTVFPSEEAIRKNNELRDGIYKLHVETADLNKQLAEARKGKDEAALEKLNNQIKELGARNKELQAKLQVSKAKRVYMANLVRDLRTEFNAPNMLVVSGTPSFDRTKDKYEQNPVVNAQREVGRMPEFQGNVAILETLSFYDHPTWPLYTEWKQHVPEWSMVGSRLACHYLGSGRFFVRLGDGLSTAMVEMMTQQR